MGLTRFFTTFFGRVLVYGVLGLVAIILAGIVLSLASVILAFGLVAFLLWMPLHSLVLGHKKTIQKCYNLTIGRCQTLGQKTIESTKSLFSNLDQAPAKVWSVFRPVSAYVLETVSGVAIAVLLIILSSPDFDPQPETMLLGIAAGGVIGFLVAWARRKKAGREKGDRHM